MSKSPQNIVDSSSTPTETTEISKERIALRAYETWQQRGYPVWEGEQDWFAAKAELDAQARDSGQAAA